MSVVLTIVCHASTGAVRKAAFPLDEPLDAPGLAKTSALAATLARADAAWTSPALRAVQTASALKLEAVADPALRDIDHGAWSGRALDDVSASDPAGMASWLADPDAAPHGGESVADLVRRLTPWLDGVGARSGREIAVTHAAVARAVVVIALDAPARAFWRIDMAPLARVRLRGSTGRWTLLSVGTDRNR